MPASDVTLREHVRTEYQAPDHGISTILIPTDFTDELKLGIRYALPI